VSAQLTLDLLARDLSAGGSVVESLGPGAVVLRGFAVADEQALLAGVDAVAAASPFRRMVTRGGLMMSVEMTNCGALGWVSDLGGYRYTAVDPEQGRAWPPLPPSFLRLAASAAARGGFEEFLPDACLVNRYQPGARLTMHQDKDERDFGAPIVSVSLGLPAVFLFGGSSRAERPKRLPLVHGDVVVWGGPARLRYHGVQPLKEGHHPMLGGQRINLTFRKAR
jgi:alkylated DNA repair protein (DNA oxidative demethylase)